jgi:hypothetical protein
MPTYKPMYNIKLKICIFLLAIVIAAGFYFKTFLSIFLYNPIINSLILFCFFCGFCLPFLQIRLLNTDSQFLFHYLSNGNITEFPPNNMMYKFLIDNQNEPRKNFSFDEIQIILMGIERRLNGRHSVTRYIMGILILLGLLGTFFGLTQTVGSISNTMDNLAVKSFGADFFNRLLDGIRSPLSGMGVAFSSSIIGLVGSLILGFFDLLQSKAEKVFFEVLESELFVRKKKMSVQGSNGPVYILALLEQTVEVMNALNEKMRQTEENRISVVKMMQDLSEVLQSRINMDSHSFNIVKDIAKQLNDTLNKIDQNLFETAKNMASLQDISALKIVQSKILEELTETRKQTTQELKNEIRMIVKTLSMLSDEPLSA